MFEMLSLKCHICDGDAMWSIDAAWTVWRCGRI